MGREMRVRNDTLTVTQCSGCSYINFFLVIYYLGKVLIESDSEDHILHLPFYVFTPD